MTGKKLILDTTLTDIADAIRAKTGDEELMTPLEMPERIKNIPVGDEAPFVLLMDGPPSSAENVAVKTDGQTPITSTHELFKDWMKVKTIDLEQMDASEVTDAASMFHSCVALTGIIMPSTGFTAVEDMSYICYGCGLLTSFDMSVVDLSACTTLQSAFGFCSNLQSLDLSNQGMSCITSMTAMFQNCSRLAELDISGVDLSNVTLMSNFTVSCNALTDVITDEDTILPAIDMGNVWNGAKNLTVQSVRNIFNALPTASDGQTIKLNNMVYNRLSADDIAIATDKGWTVTH